jgi:hypothetical protein
LFLPAASLKRLFAERLIFGVALHSALLCRIALVRQLGNFYLALPLDIPSRMTVQLSIQKLTIICLSSTETTQVPPKQALPTGGAPDEE